jgi:hypothetical protein
MMSSDILPLESRNLSSGLAKRTLKNLDFIKHAVGTGDVHFVTQVVNSLLALLVFPVEKEQQFFKTFANIKFKDPSDLSTITATITKHLPVPSLQVAVFARCEDLATFFRKIRNAVSHKNLEFSGDADSRFPAAVTITLRDRPSKKGIPPPFDWEISMTVEDLEELSRFVAKEIIDQGL